MNISTFGSNADGYYIKFDSGIVIQWNTISNVSSSSTGQRSNLITLPVRLYTSDGAFGIAHFADSFRGHGSGYIPNIADVTGIYNDDFSLMLTINNTYSDNQNIIRWVIIGRWK